MKLKITVDIFSGLKNPVMVLNDKDSKSFLSRVEIQSKEEQAKSRPAPFHLGYRGLIVEQLEEKSKDYPDIMHVFGDMIYGKENNLRILNKEAEDFVVKNLDRVNNIELWKGFDKYIIDEFEKSKNFRDKFDWDKYRRLKWPIYKRLNPCYCAPVYEPTWWNDGGQIQGNNNCYNYGTNYRTDTYAQPGEASGMMRSWPVLSCSDSPGYISPKTAAISDGLIDTPGADNKCPRPGHLVALVIAPAPAMGGSGDFHWYRKGNNGRWTHKPGGGQATNVDNSGNVITDPRTADRGEYTVFCTFMKVLHGHIKLV